MSAVQRLGVLAVPWIFVAVYAALYLALLLPRVQYGGLAVLVAVVAAAVWCSFAVAAVTFSRDVLAGRWPA
jgi:hypothetical protein